MVLIQSCNNEGRNHHEREEVSNLQQQKGPHGEDNAVGHSTIQKLLNTTERLQQEIQDMKLKIEELQRGQQSQLVCRQSLVGQGEILTPFSDTIMSVELPQHVKQPVIKSYDGTTDPDEHLALYKSQMLVIGTYDAVLCRAFPATLKREALLWFWKLPQRSVNSFAELSHKFVTQFSMSRMPRKNKGCIMYLKQGSYESLKSFMIRFNQEAIQIQSLSFGLALHALECGLKPGPFFDSLVQRPPADMDELRKRAVTYINQEENLKRKNRDPYSEYSD